MTASIFRLVFVSLLLSICQGQTNPISDPFNSMVFNETESVDNSTIAPTLNIPPNDFVNATKEPVTEAPTITPVSASFLVGEVSLKLTNTPSLLVGQVETDFLDGIATFLVENVHSGLGEGDVLDVSRIGILRQYRPTDQRALMSHGRDLQDASPLFVDLRVSGQYTRAQGAVELDLSDLLGLLFTNFADEFIVILRDQNEDTFFNSLEAVKVVTETSSPTNGPTSPPVPETYREPDDGEDDEFWSIGVIVGVAAAGAVMLILLLAICCRLTSEKKGLPQHASLAKGLSHSGSFGPFGLETALGTVEPSPKDTTRQSLWSRKSGADPRQPERNSGDQSTASLPLQEQPSDLESNGLYSYIKTESDSMIGGSGMQSNSVYGHDDMSYAYSLQAGLEPSVAPGYSTDQSSIQPGASMVPIEIPQIKIPAPKAKPSDTRKMEEPAQDLQLSPSDLRLTESDLALLPSNLRDSFEENSRTKTKTTPPPPPSRVVMAPPGKLGIVIDTTIDGPVVHHVNNASALKGKIFPGDIIVAIDNVDTRAMSASAITSLMIKTAKQKRRLTIVEAKDRPKKKGTTVPVSNKRS